jgi:hypothetical protein
LRPIRQFGGHGWLWKDFITQRRKGGNKKKNFFGNILAPSLRVFAALLDKNS